MMEQNKASGSSSPPHRRNPPRDTPRFHVPLRAADAKRLAKNILTWNAYWPTDCVRTMVRMGWDYTT
jgi:hypothetical protein